MLKLGRVLLQRLLLLLLLAGKVDSGTGRQLVMLHHGGIQPIQLLLVSMFVFLDDTFVKGDDAALVRPLLAVAFADRGPEAAGLALVRAGPGALHVERARGAFPVRIGHGGHGRALDSLGGRWSEGFQQFHRGGRRRRLGSPAKTTPDEDDSDADDDDGEDVCAEDGTDLNRQIRLVSQRRGRQRRTVFGGGSWPFVDTNVPDIFGIGKSCRCGEEEKDGRRVKAEI